MRHIRLFGVLVALVGVVGACSAADDDDGGDEGVRVDYFIYSTVDDTVSVTYTNESGNTEQQEIEIGMASTWTQRYTMRSGDFVSISAQRGAGAGTIRCTINADNERIERAESSGEFVIASCSGSVP